MTPDQVQSGNRTWWSSNPMTYDWHGEIKHAEFSPAWFDAIDGQFIYASRLYATARRPFDRIIPLDGLHGKRVLEIGCGMGLHTETMARAGAIVTAVNLAPRSIEATNKRLTLKGLDGVARLADAEHLPFDGGAFDFVWSWGVIHHSARTARIVREITRVLTDAGACRVMVYNREGAAARIALLKDHIVCGGFLRQSYEETLFRSTDGFSARFYVRDQFEDLFRAFFRTVDCEVLGQDADVLPLPRWPRRMLARFLTRNYMERAQARRGSFLFLRAEQKE